MSTWVQCSVCGRRLTSAASVAAGVGPKCGGGRGRGRRHAIPRLRKLGGRVSASGNVSPDKPMPITEALAAVRQVAEKGPTWEVVG
jgi:hypothetical protein